MQSSGEHRRGSRYGCAVAVRPARRLQAEHDGSQEVVPGSARPLATSPVQLAAAIGNRAFGQLLRHHAQRATATPGRRAAAGPLIAREPPVEVPSPPALAAPAPEAPTLDVAELATELRTKGASGLRLSTTERLKDLWGGRYGVEAGVLAAPRKDGSLPSSKWPALRTPERIEVLKTMTPEQRIVAAAALFDGLVRDLTDEALTGEGVAEEAAALGRRAERAVGYKQGWPFIRTAVLEKFGTVENAHDYYESNIVDTTFFGRPVEVHRELALALASAEIKFITLGGDPGTVIFNSLGGLVVRPNTNNPKRLSDHSYGSAIDIDGMDQNAGKGVAAGNPNVKVAELEAQGIPDFWTFVRDITGEDVFKRTPKGRKVDDSSAGPAEVGIAEAERLAALSERIREMFSGEQALAAAMAAYVEANQIIVPPGGEAVLVTQGLAAAIAPANLPAIEATLQQWFGESGTPEMSLDTSHIATRLMQMGKMFIASGNATGAGVETPLAKAKGTIGSIAAHGFMNLDPLLVGALTADDGGRLTWLGATAGTKDFMHFELPEPPAIPAAAAPAPEPAPA
jgi:hypothetical protein